MSEPNGGLFANEGAPYAPFKTIGTSYSGEVISTGKVQSRAYDRDNPGQGKLEFWPDLKPKWTYIITIQTDLRDPEIEGDDGSRSLWIKGKSMETSVRNAVRASGAQRDGILVGGWLAMRFTHETPNIDASPTKHYEVKYVPPQATGNEPLVAQPVVATPAQSSPAQQSVDLSNLSPEAAAKVQAMLAAQGQS